MLTKALLTGLVLATSLLTLPSIEPYKYPSHWNQDGKGKTFVLYRKHNVKEMSQGPVGSCVGCAVAKSLELMHGQKFSPEWLYGGGRKHFGEHKSRYPGSFVAYSAQLIKDKGALPSLDYSVMGDDLRVYSPARAKRWERGPPDSYDLVATGYRSGFVKINNWEQLRDAIANGIPVVVGSQVGFGSTRGVTRTSDGRLRSRWWSRWGHAMVFCGVSDGRSKRALLLNSWGKNWISGPKWLGDEPDGSFWISKADCEKMISYDDCWAILPIPGMNF